MSKSIRFLFFALIAISFSFCTPAEETTNSQTISTNDRDTSFQQNSQKNIKEKEIYIFDDVSSDSSNVLDVTQKIEENNTVSKIHNEKKSHEMFTVQIGAFSTEDKAQKFVNDNKSKIRYNTRISFSQNVNLFVIQLSPVETRQEAEKIRNELWQIKEFKDAFIARVNE